MKLVICLMGYQCSGIYKIKDYLVDRYGVKEYKGYTTRKKHPKANLSDMLLKLLIKTVQN